MNSSKTRPFFLLFGDSMCQNSFAGNGWGARLAAHYCRKADIVNRGFGGYNTRWALKLLRDEELLSTLPDKARCMAVFIWIVNDTVLASSGDRRFVPLDEFTRNMTSIVSTLVNFFEQPGLTIILITPPPIVESKRLAYQVEMFKEKATGVCERSTVNNGLYAAALLEVTRKFEGKAHMVLFDARSCFLKEKNWEDFLSDGLHLSPAGDAVVFHGLLRTIEERCPQISFASLPNHFLWHNEIDRFANAFESRRKRQRPSSGSGVTMLKGAKLWDWASMSFQSQSIAISKGRFVSVPLEETGEDNTEIDLSGRYILPGLVDAHIHVYNLGQFRQILSLEGCTSVKEVQDRLKAYVTDGANSKKQWIVGAGWDHEQLGELPSRQMLDAVSPDRPVFLWRVCRHIAVVNTKAFEVCSVPLDDPPRQPDGSIDVDEAGVVTGVVREVSTQIFLDRLDESDSELRRHYVVKGLEECLKSGLTAVQTNDENCFEVYKSLNDAGELPIRVHLTSSIEELNERTPYESENGMFYQQRLKIFADGALGAGTAALIKPGGDGFTGILYYAKDDLKEKITKAWKKGFQLEVHVIGDAAAEQVVSVMSEVQLPYRERPVLTHCQVLNEELVARMARLGAVANIQPSFVPTDANWVHDRLHASKLRWSYCWKSLIQNGVQVAGGSDAPVESCSPLKGLFDAVFRPTSHESHENVFQESERLTFGQALHMYTLGANYACKAEERRGALEPGFEADFVVVDKDLARQPELLKEARVLEVWVRGVRRYSAEEGEGSLFKDNPRFPLLRGKNGPRRSYVGCKCCK